MPLFLHWNLRVCFRLPFLHFGRGFVFQGEDKKAIHRIYELVAALFPQCSDKEKGRDFTPHLTVGKFKNQKDLKATQAKLQSTWVPITWKGALLAIIRFC